MRRVGNPAPMIPRAQFTLWDLGATIVRDAEDEATEKDLRVVVEREAIRRQEAAAAKPLDPFHNMSASRLHPEFEELLALLEKQPDLLTVHEGEIFPGDALPARLRKALHNFALHPRARATLLNTVKYARNRAVADQPARSPTSSATLAAVARPACDSWQR
jgi:hypothetical protein